ncbi:MAG: prepilin-type N-terminal cleavage/methylation domain-containing protein [Akkermansiaceae bacterium]|nr:prepilin-type N-terminal cleavage/methylation domain-containing protein [Akkermansiaceae bacterium]
MITAINKNRAAGFTLMETMIVVVVVAALAVIAYSGGRRMVTSARIVQSAANLRSLAAAPLAGRRQHMLSRGSWRVLSRGRSFQQPPLARRPVLVRRELRSDARIPVAISGQKHAGDHLSPVPRDGRGFVEF